MLFPGSGENGRKVDISLFRDFRAVRQGYSDHSPDYAAAAIPLGRRRRNSVPGINVVGSDQPQRVIPLDRDALGFNFGLDVETPKASVSLKAPSFLSSIADPF